MFTHLLVIFGIFIGVEHPSIMRAIYIDGPLYQPNDFLTNLIVFAIRLRNAGILDHGLIVQLSEIVAGSIYGAGHSVLYNEVDVYMYVEVNISFIHSFNYIIMYKKFLT